MTAVKNFWYWGEGGKGYGCWVSGVWEVSVAGRFETQ